MIWSRHLIDPQVVWDDRFRVSLDVDVTSSRLLSPHRSQILHFGVVCVESDIDPTTSCCLYR